MVETYDKRVTEIRKSRFNPEKKKTTNEFLKTLSQLITWMIILGVIIGLIYLFQFLNEITGGALGLK